MAKTWNSRHFVIYDRGDSKSTNKRCTCRTWTDPKTNWPQQNTWNNFTWKEIFTSRSLKQKRRDDYMGTLLKFGENMTNSEKDKTLDFDDLLFKTAHLLSTHQDVGVLSKQMEICTRWWVSRPNQVQYRIVQLLVHKHRNLAVVGDGDQSIYGWKVRIKKHFEIWRRLSWRKNYSSRTNYRSTQTILQAANKVIQKRISTVKKKNLFTKKEGEK